MGRTMSGPTRGFLGRRRPERDERLPPGQYDIGKDFPVLTAEVTPRLDPDRWTMRVDGLVADEHTWTWEDMHLLLEVRHQFRRGECRSAARCSAAATRGHARPGHVDDGLYDQPAARAHP